MSFLITLVCSIFLLYEATASAGVLNLPYIGVSNNNVFFGLMRLVVLKWSLILGIAGLAYTVIGYFYLRNNEKFKVSAFFPIFYLICCVFAVL